MNYSEGLHTAINIIELLEPYCEKIVVAGSVRRRKRTVKDVEIVCIPKAEQLAADLFGQPILQRSPDFVKVVDGMVKVKGDAVEGKYMQRIIGDPETDDYATIDIFTAVPENWGVILAIRTGPADFSHYCIAKRAHKFDMRVQGGMLTLRGEQVAVETEQELFSMLEMEWIEPERRDEKWVLDKYGPSCKTPRHA